MAKINFPYEYRTFDDSLLAALAGNQRTLGQFIQSRLLDTTVAADTYVKKAGSTMTGALTLAGDPTSAHHAASKEWVEAQMAGSVGDAATLGGLARVGFAEKTGATFSGAVGLSGGVAVGTSFGGGGVRLQNIAQSAATTDAVRQDQVVLSAAHTAAAHSVGSMNVNADQVDGYHASDLAAAGHTHTNFASLVIGGNLQALAGGITYFTGSTVNVDDVTAVSDVTGAHGHFTNIYGAYANITDLNGGSLQIIGGATAYSFTATEHLHGYFIYSTTQVSAASYITRSDIGLKENVGPLGFDVLPFLQDLRPVSFRWRADGRRALGLIAQDVQKAQERHVIPAPLVEKDGFGELGIDYSQLIPVLVEAVNTLAARVADLEAAR
jgi:hypothetical protein